MRWGEILPLIEEARQPRWIEPPKPLDWDDIPAFRRRSEAVKARLRRLNPDGPNEALIPRGWHPHGQINRTYFAAMPVRAVITRFGRAAFDALPRSAFVFQGRRRAVKAERVHQMARAA